LVHVTSCTLALQPVPTRRSSDLKADALSVDVTQAREVKAVVTDVEKRFGRIDVLANIAGGSFYTKRIEEFTWAEWKEVIDVNLKDRKSTRLNSSHEWISYAVFCL